MFDIEGTTRQKCQTPEIIRPFTSSSSRNSYFINEAKYKTFVVKMSFICMRIKNRFHINDLISLTLKPRLKETRKWPIARPSWSQKSLVTHHQAEWSNMSQLIPEHIGYYILLYKHQWNTRWAFVRKLDIFTCENNMLSSHVKISPLLWLHNKSHLSHQKTVKVKWFGISLVFIQ